MDTMERRRNAIAALINQNGTVSFSTIKEHFPNVSEMTLRFINGTDDIDAGWDEYVAQVEGMGIQKVIDCYQAAYERYEAR